MQVFIALIREDIPAGTLVVRDLSPTAFLRRPAYDSKTQGPYYVRPLTTESVLTTGTTAISTVRAAQGLAAYLISHVEAEGLGTTTGALTSTQANACAAAIIAELQASNDLDLTAVNAALAGEVADTELTDAGGSNSSGSLTDLLAILAGKEFTLPAGTQIQSNTNVFVPMGPTATAANFNEGSFRRLFDTDAFEMSFVEGNLAYYTSAAFTYKGVTGAAVAVYGSDGVIYDPS
jgi:hypothetical protein